MQLPTNRIIQGDCRKVMEKFPDCVVDLTVTSPPYDRLRENEEYNADFDFEGVAKELYRVTKDGGVVVWVVDDQVINGSKSLTSFKQAIHFKEEVGFNVHDVMIWKKPGAVAPSSTRYQRAFEYMFILSRGKPNTFNPIKDRKNKTNGPLGRNTRRRKDGTLEEHDSYETGEYGMRSNVWEIKTASQEKPCQSLPHPAMFSEELVRDHIKSWSNRGDLVLDPMCGSGTTCKVAMEKNRDFIGIEISEKYCSIARKRLKLDSKKLDSFIKESDNMPPKRPRKECNDCKLGKEGKGPVLPTGPQDADILIIGEAPGKKEATLNKPFVGDAGSILMDGLKRAGLSREDVYITNAVKCKPPGNRDPKKEEISTCLDKLKIEVERVKPDVIVTLGRFATNIFFDDVKVTEVSGEIKEVEGTKILPVIHPASTFYGKGKKQKFMSDIGNLETFSPKGQSNLDRW